nr:hypothetical protein [uncultured Friedmanniella sp.]
MEGVAWVFVGAAAVATLVALLAFLVPLGRGSGQASGVRRADASSSSPVGSLARGFSYLHVSPRSSTRRAGVHDRLQRAFARIDAVDPHEAPRRIGEALLQAGLADSGTRPPPTDPPEARPTGSHRIQESSHE